jgi:hypothetical protein
MKVEAKEVLKFDIELSSELNFSRVSVYTNLKNPWEKYEKDSLCEKEIEDWKDDIRDLYFSKEKIEELKNELCKKIMESENPFEIYCADWDGGYLVEESDLLENQVKIQ